MYTSGLLPTERINSKRLQDYADFELLDQLDDEFADPEFYVDQFYRQVKIHSPFSDTFTKILVSVDTSFFLGYLAHVKKKFCFEL